MSTSLRFFAAIAAVLSLSLPLAACGDGGSGGEGGGGTSGDALTSCNALCDAQAKGTDCTAASADTCKALCSLLVPALSADCQAKAVAAYDCQKNASWSCPNGGSVAISTDQTCSAETAAFQPCL